MRVLLVILAILIVAAALLIGFQHDSGYVIIHFAHSQIELAFWTALVGILIGFIVLYLVVRILARLFGLGSYFRKRKKMRTANHMKELTENGLVDTINGRWSHANSQLEKAATLARNKMIPRLLCALSAHMAGNWATRDLALSTIDAKNKDEQTTFQLAKAQFLMASHEWEKALACLKNLYQHNPSHPQINFLLAKTAYHLHEWSLLNDLLPHLKKTKGLDSTLLLQWQEIGFAQELQQAARQSTDLLTDAWRRADRDERDRTSAKVAYIQGLLYLREYARAKIELAAFLKKTFDPQVCVCYTQFPANEAESLLSAVDRLCQQHPGQLACRKTLGILCLKSKHFVRAREILIAAVKEAPCRDSLQALANVYQADGEWERAAKYFSQALNVS